MLEVYRIPKTSILQGRTSSQVIPNPEIRHVSPHVHVVESDLPLPPGDPPGVHNLPRFGREGVRFQQARGSGGRFGADGEVKKEESWEEAKVSIGAQYSPN